MWQRFLAAWCRKMHDEAMWPINGRYVCRRCLREHRVVWEDEPAAIAPQTATSTASASMDACA